MSIGLVELHQHVKASVDLLADGQVGDGLRDLIESGAVEGFLAGLLYIRLQSCGFRCTREFPFSGKSSVDIAIHAPTELYVEIKQLRLAEGTKRMDNLPMDMRRHAGLRCLGVLYFADERASSRSLAFHRFRGANRKARYGPETILRALPEHFRDWWPRTVGEAEIANFPLDGGVRLYAFATELAAQ